MYLLLCAAAKLLDIHPDAIGAELAGGSNNWALSGQHISTGRPIVAGDPHRQLEMPNMYARLMSPAKTSTSSG
jgi:acyl-homoserine lactone acylase PvdQ